MTGGLSLILAIASYKLPDQYGVAAIAISFVAAWVAAYRVWKAEYDGKDELHQRLTPKIKVSLVGTEPIEFGWPQIAVGPLTDAALTNCEVTIRKIALIQDTGEVTPLSVAPFSCFWTDATNLDNFSVNIPSGVEKRAFLVRPDRNERALILPNTRRTGTTIRFQGLTSIFRIDVVISADNAPSESKSFKFNVDLRSQKMALSFWDPPV